VAQEVVSSLIPPQGGLGVLAQVEKYCQQNNIIPLAATSNPGPSVSTSAQQPSRTQFEQMVTPQQTSAPRNNLMSSSQIPHHSAGINPSGHNSVPKQRLKSATMNKRMHRGISRENDDGVQYEDMTQQQYHGYTGHIGNQGMPAVGGA
jgi:hypothetical protein